MLLQSNCGASHSAWLNYILVERVILDADHRPRASLGSGEGTNIERRITDIRILVPPAQIEFVDSYNPGYGTAYLCLPLIQGQLGCFPKERFSIHD